MKCYSGERLLLPQNLYNVSETINSNQTNERVTALESRDRCVSPLRLTPRDSESKLSPKGCSSKSETEREQTSGVHLSFMLCAVSEHQRVNIILGL